MGASQTFRLTLTQLRDAVAALDDVQDINSGVGPFVALRYVATDSDDLRVIYGDQDWIIPTRSLAPPEVPLASDQRHGLEGPEDGQETGQGHARAEGVVMRWYVCWRCGTLGTAEDLAGECAPNRDHDVLVAVATNSPARQRLVGAVDTLRELDGMALAARNAGQTLDPETVAAMCDAALAPLVGGQ